MAGAKDSGCDDDLRIAGGCDPGKRGNPEDSSSPVEVSCSICLESVLDDGTRSKAKLQCGHQFHLGISFPSSISYHFAFPPSQFDDPMAFCLYKLLCNYLMVDLDDN